MSVLRSLEEKLAGLVEGTFSRAFKSEVRPVEIARKLAREMDEHKVVSLSRTYVPNEYTVWLSQPDREQFSGYEDDLREELSSYLLEHARRERVALVSRPEIGFEVDERLHLLSHNLENVPPMPETAVPLRRGKSSDWPAVLDVDAGSFAAFWRLDNEGLREAIEATPVSRFRVASPRRGGPVLAYAVTGLSGNQGYLQRLAVHPAAQRAGRGRALAVDGLHWLRRKGVRRAVVNTQVGNAAAFDLYVGLGFRPQPNDLVVLRRELG